MLIIAPPIDDFTLNIADGDKALTWFFGTCADAGPERCSFHAESSEAIRERYHGVETLVKNSKIILPDGIHFDVNFMQALMFSLLYDPGTFPLLAEILASIEQNDMAPILEHLAKGAGVSPFVTVSLRCTDTAVVNDTAEELEEYSVRVGSASEYFSGAVAGVRLSCG